MALTATRATQDEESRPAYHSLSEACGLSLHAYRTDHVDGRIERSLEREGLDHADDLIALVRRDARARERFRRMLAISVTGRFRDPHQFDLLSETVLPDLLNRADGLRVWSAGCSNGLELLSVATLLDRAGTLERSRLLGSDVLAENIDIARAGGVDGIPESAAVASRCRWEVRDLISDPAPDGQFDLILCRNVAIYFTRETRAALMAAFGRVLARGGVLMLGRSERLMEPGRYGLDHYAPHCYRRPL